VTALLALKEAMLKYPRTKQKGSTNFFTFVLRRRIVFLCYKLLFSEEEETTDDPRMLQEF
jgi:hypothetical protein